MNILGIIGSRNPSGKTGSCVDCFLDTVRSKAHDVGKIFLTEKKIEKCKQCDINGWGKCRTDGFCVINDDFSEIVEYIRKSDGIVFATPVYFSDLSESMKTFLDRLRRISRNEKGRQGITEKPVIGICVAGGGGGGSVMCSFFLERTLLTCGFVVVDMIPVRRQNLSLKQEILRITGNWFVQHISGGAYKQ